MPAATDPDTPVIVGVGQITCRDAGPDPARTPVELMVAAAEAAAADGGVPLADVSAWIAMPGAHRYPDPARLVADRVGAEGVKTWQANFGGHHPQRAVAHLAATIAAGELDCGIVIGGECDRNRHLLEAEGVELDRFGPEVAPADRFGDDSPIPGDDELAVGAGTPAVAYALFESALRAAAGTPLDQHRRTLGRLWARFSQVAAANPHAWSRTAVDADTIATPGPDNRMVADPYTKLLCANPRVDMAAAVIVCSLDHARRHGADLDRVVYPLVSARGVDTTAILTRRRLDTSVAVEPVARAAFAHAQLGADDVALADLYACFPSVVQMTAQAVGLSREGDLTVTGGLNFGGGPLNSANLHSIATMVDRLRPRPGAVGLVHGNGGVATKHAVGLYRTDPPTVAFADIDAQPRIDQQPRATLPDHVGDATIAGVTVTHGRDGPQHAVAVLRTSDGGQCFATSTDPDLFDAVASTELVGATARRDDAGHFELIP